MLKIYHQLTAYWIQTSRYVGVFSNGVKFSTSVFTFIFLSNRTGGLRKVEHQRQSGCCLATMSCSIKISRFHMRLCWLRSRLPCLQERKTSLCKRCSSNSPTKEMLWTSGIWIRFGAEKTKLSVNVHLTASPVVKPHAKYNRAIV